MGFNTKIGFRAGTSFHFEGYDFIDEKSSGLLNVPFSMMDSAIWIASDRSPTVANKLLEYFDEWGKEKFIQRTVVYHLSVQREHQWMGINYPPKKKAVHSLNE